MCNAWLGFVCPTPTDLQMVSNLMVLRWASAFLPERFELLPDTRDKGSMWLARWADVCECVGMNICGVVYLIGKLYKLTLNGRCERWRMWCMCWDLIKLQVVNTRWRMWANWAHQEITEHIRCDGYTFKLFQGLHLPCSPENHLWAFNSILNCISSTWFRRARRPLLHRRLDTNAPEN